MFRKSLLSLVAAAAVAVPVMTLAGVSSIPMIDHVRVANHTSMAVSSQFAGVKANVGTVTASNEDGKLALTLSDDFVIPNTPAPHWQVVDTDGNVYLLQRLKIKGDKVNKTIIVPSYVGNVAKVQIWCAFAETLLGEASFTTPVK